MNVECKSVTFAYGAEPLIQNLSLSLRPAEPVWIHGQSGAGKSTLLRLIAGFFSPQRGEIKFNGESSSHWSESKRKEFRLAHIGYVHQENHLIRHWTVEQNLAVNKAQEKFAEVLTQVGLPSSVLKAAVENLSGGERQRVDIARLVLKQPELALLDEPTAHLDDQNTVRILSLILSLLKNSAILIVSHDSRLKQFPFKSLDFGSLK